MFNFFRSPNCGHKYIYSGRTQWRLKSSSPVEKGKRWRERELYVINKSFMSNCSLQSTKCPLCLRRPRKTFCGCWKKFLFRSRSWAFMTRINSACCMAGDSQGWWCTLWLTFLSGSITNRPRTPTSSSPLYPAELLSWFSMYWKSVLDPSVLQIVPAVLLVVAVSFEEWVEIAASARLSLSIVLPKQVKLVLVSVCLCTLVVLFFLGPEAAVS